MSGGRVKYSQSAGGEYEVWDGTRSRLGIVRKRTKRYNLRRVIVDTWWQIDGVAGFNDGALYDNGKHHYDTRKDAVEALLRFLGRTDLSA